jgi:hypothetical protein
MRTYQGLEGSERLGLLALPYLLVVLVKVPLELVHLHLGKLLSLLKVPFLLVGLMYVSEVNVNRFNGLCKLVKRELCVGVDVKAPEQSVDLGLAWWLASPVVAEK